MAFIKCSLVKTALNNIINHSRSVFTSRKLYIKPETDEKEQEIEFEVDIEEKLAEEARINKIRNKSRLLDQHRNMVNGIPPYTEPQSWIHNSLKYQRKQYALYGEGNGSQIDPSKIK